MSPGSKIHQPMIGGGPQRPRQTGKERVAEAEKEYLKALTDAGALFEELRANPALTVAVVELEKRINQILVENEFCVALLKIIKSWKTTLEAPQIAEDKLNRLLGPQLSSIRKRTQAAP